MYNIIVTITIFLLFLNSTFSQSLNGTSGLFNIPTAEILNDGEIAIGVNFLEKKYLEYTNKQYNGVNYYATIGFLPFLEISLRITRFINPPFKQALGDRMPSVRLKLINESKILPSILIGVHDFANVLGGTDAVHFNALYIVSSKNLSTKFFFNKIGFHLGYGTDWIEANHRQFVGIFGGISFEHKNIFRSMLEYDADKFNWGAEVILFKHIKLLAGLMHFDSFNAGICYKTTLF